MKTSAIKSNLISLRGYSHYARFDPSRVDEFSRDNSALLRNFVVKDLLQPVYRIPNERGKSIGDLEVENSLLEVKLKYGEGRDRDWGNGGISEAQRRASRAEYYNRDGGNGAREDRLRKNNNIRTRRDQNTSKSRASKISRQDLENSRNFRKSWKFAGKSDFCKNPGTKNENPKFRDYSNNSNFIPQKNESSKYRTYGTQQIPKTGNLQGPYAEYNQNPNINTNKNQNLSNSYNLMAKNDHSDRNPNANQYNKYDKYPPLPRHSKRSNSQNNLFRSLPFRYKTKTPKAHLSAQKTPDFNGIEPPNFEKLNPTITEFWSKREGPLFGTFQNLENRKITNGQSSQKVNKLSKIGGFRREEQQSGFGHQFGNNGRDVFNSGQGLELNNVKQAIVRKRVSSCDELMAIDIGILV